MKLALTGHRAKKLDWSGENAFEKLTSDLMIIFAKLGVDYLYEGQADGVDLMGAWAAHKLEIPFEAVVPYAGHQSMMQDEFWTKVWQNAIDAADRVEILSDSISYPGHWVMHNRNHYMVDHADKVLAVWNGDEFGGTWNAVKYARTKGKEIHVFNPVTRDWTIDGQG